MHASYNLQLVLDNQAPIPLHIQTVLSETFIEQLIEYSQTDELVRRFSHDDTRFKDRAAVQAWLAKNRTLYILTDEQDHLYGIIWFGEKPFPSLLPEFQRYGMTFAIRIYGKARGKHLALPFMRQAFELFMQTPAYKKAARPHFWLITDRENVRAQSLYAQFGFKPVPHDDQGSLAMVLN